MSMHERTGERDLTYSRWHRPASIKRYIGPREAAKLTVIDIDWCEACHACRQPLALVETVRGNNPGTKPATITENLAVMAGIDAFILSFDVDDGEITSFRMLRAVSDGVRVAGTVYDLTPAQWAELLVALRAKHARHCRPTPHPPAATPTDLTDVARTVPCDRCVGRLCDECRLLAGGIQREIRRRQTEGRNVPIPFQGTGLQPRSVDVGTGDER